MADSFRVPASKTVRQSGLPAHTQLGKLLFRSVSARSEKAETPIVAEPYGSPLDVPSRHPASP